MENLNNTLSKVIGECVDDAENVLDTSLGFNSNVRTMILVLAFVCILITCILWITITRSILRPVNEIKKAAQAVADGKLWSDLSYVSDNELGQLAESIRETTKALMMDEISEVSVQQADAIMQVRRSMDLISDIVQGNSASSEESAAASEELSAQAQMLKELVEQFEI